MIKPLDPGDIAIAKKLRQVFIDSYKVEAELLGALDFPPLKRTLESYVTSEGEFFGYVIDDLLAGATEIKSDQGLVHIQSLVVHPNHFRKGIGTQLLQFVFTNFQGSQFMVETGVDNTPACLLYEKHGFKEVTQWDTDHGVRKIRYIKD